jgi:hypothetical protein
MRKRTLWVMGVTLVSAGGVALASAPAADYWT